MPQGSREKKRSILVPVAYPKSLSTSVSPHTWAPPLVHCTDLLQGRRYPAWGGLTEGGVFPLLCPLKILETPSTLSSLEVLGLGELLVLLGGAISPPYGGSKKTKPRDSVSGLWFLSLSLASSFLLLESSPATFHQSGSQLTSAESLSSETPTSC